MPVKDVLASRLGLPRNMNKGKVCRCLFGKPDHEEIRRDLDAQLKNIGKEFTSTWNYDPVLDEPLDGRYEWSETTDAPEFYTRGYRQTKFLKKRDNLAETESTSSDSDSDNEQEKRVAIRLTESNNSEDERAEALDMKRENEKTPEAKTVRQTRIPGKFSSQGSSHNECAYISTE